MRAHKVIVQRLARVLFEVRACQVDGVLFAIQKKGNRAAEHDGDFVLADLIVFRQVGIKIVFAREHRARRDLGADSQAKTDGALDRGAIHHGQCSWQRQVHLVGLRIGQGTKTGGTA